MPRRSRFRRFAKWIGLVLCVLIAATWVASLWWSVWYSGVVIFRGIIGIYHDSNPFDGTGHLYMRNHKPILWPSPIFGSQIRLPLWIPFFIMAIPTVALWLRDRHPTPGHCQSCGYDLTGNVSGVCPECGQKVAPMSHSEGTK